jgi:hypothetical protein
MLKYNRILLLLLTVTCIFGISCKKNSAIGEDISFVSVYNATTDVLGLNFLINGEQISTSTLSIGQHTGYYGVYQGVWSTEAIPNNNTTTSKKRDLTFTASEHNSLFVIGTADSLDYFIIKDDLTVKDPNKVKVKFLNLLSHSGALNLEIALLGTVSRFPGFEYKKFSDYQNFNAGTVYTITLKDSLTDTIVGTPVTAEFIQGKVYTVWAKGSADATVDAAKVGVQISEVN